MTLFKSLGTLTFLLLTIYTSYSQTVTRPALVGQYISIDSKFEKTSTLTLGSDSTFLYSYMLGGCQDKIKGKWMLKDRIVTLQMNIKVDTLSSHQPNLNNTTWTVTKKGIRPNTTIDNGCFEEKALHVRVKYQ